MKMRSGLPQKDRWTLAFRPLPFGNGRVVFASPSLWEGRTASGRGGLRAESNAEPSPRFSRPSQGEGDEKRFAKQQRQDCTTSGNRRVVILGCHVEHGLRAALGVDAALLTRQVVILGCGSEFLANPATGGGMVRETWVRRLRSRRPRILLRRRILLPLPRLRTPLRLRFARRLWGQRWRWFRRSRR